MAQPIVKFQPDRCVSLRGFSGFGAAAAITKASATGFTVSGVFRAADDFAVVVIYDEDDFFEHPINKYLPDPNLAGLVLEFDLTFTGLQPIDSAKYPTIDWAYLDVAKADGTAAQIPLFANANQNGGTYTAASTVIQIAAAPAVAFDRVTVWYQNNAADYVASGGESATTVAAALAATMNTWADVSAVADGPNITITARKAGIDGNMLTLYTQSKTATLVASPAVAPLAGGSSDATWHVRLDFTALGIDQVRQAWLTLAPQLANGAAYQDTEFKAGFSNWGITSDPNGIAALKVAGPGSVRIEETDDWCTYSGSSWTPTSGGGFYSHGFAKVASTPGDSVTIQYWCGERHDLWVGTALYVDRGVGSILIDGVPQPNLNTFLSALEPVVTRRKVGSAIAAGQHAVTITLVSGLFYFDFLEAVVAGDPPIALPALTDRSAALDYDTDSTYKLSPQRLLWSFDQLGFAGPMNLYLGVFWALNRKAVGGTIPSVTIDFSQRTYATGTGFGDGDQVFLNISGELFGKSVFPADAANTSLIAAHFAYFINGISVGVWAQANGPILTISARAAGTAYSFTFTPYVATPATVALTFSGSLAGPVQPDWYVDTSQEYALTRAVRDWVADLCAEVAARGFEISISFSMEFVFPPDDPASGQVWAQRWPDGTVVGTATGFSTLVSIQCSFTSAVLAHHKRMFAEVAGLQAAAGLTPEVQFGEFSWWYFPNAASSTSIGMAFYDAETKAAALASLGRPLHVFQTPDDDPAAWPADSSFLAQRLASYVQQLGSFLRQSFSSILLEWLLPLDVNYPRVAGKFNLGGKLLHFVNIPVALIDPHQSAFDLVKIECLDFGAADRNMDLAAAAMAYPFGQGWDPQKLRYLVAVFNGGTPHLAEQQLAFSAGYLTINYWAWDHIQLFGWDVRLQVLPSAQVV